MQYFFLLCLLKNKTTHTLEFLLSGSKMILTWLFSLPPLVEININYRLMAFWKEPVQPWFISMICFVKELLNSVGMDVNPCNHFLQQTKGCHWRGRAIETTLHGSHFFTSEASYGGWMYVSANGCRMKVYFWSFFQHLHLTIHHFLFSV